MQVPSKPKDIATNDAARLEYRRGAAEAIRANIQNTSRRLQAEETVRVASKFSEYGEFYLPYQLDFRGRIYSIPQSLNPQSGDLARGLLEFGEAKPIVDDEAVMWLCIHLANTFGYDKASREARVMWVEENRRQIEACANDPYAHRWWAEAEEPWQFLAACRDFTDLMKHGMGWESRIPVYMDASCSGLQHLSAMMLDEVGGKATNLMPNDEPADIYSQVAAVVGQRLQADASNQYAQMWMAFGINRKLVKRPVMTTPYGVTMYSIRSFLVERAVELIKKRQAPNLFDNQLMTASTYLAQHVTEAISQTVRAAPRVMAWLQSSAAVLAGENLPVYWTTPVGFPVLQSYPMMRHRRVKLTIGGVIRKVTLQEPNDNAVDERRQEQGMAPNVTHSLDAALLMRGTNLSFDRGVSALSPVHDAFGTHAASGVTVDHSLRESFYRMYSETNVLADIQQNLNDLLGSAGRIPDPPTRGNLDLSLVLDSDYFVS